MSKYVNILTNKLETETIPNNIQYGLYYQKYINTNILNKIITKAEYLGGCYNNNNINKFINDYNINYNNAILCKNSKSSEECAKKYKTINDFFTREITNNSKYKLNNHKIISPAESYVLYVNNLDNNRLLNIKNTNFNINKLLSFKPKYDYYSAFIFRLGPKHYHHFYMPIEGIIKHIKKIENNNHLSVQPEFLKYHDIFTTNSRIIVSIDTIFGLVYLILVGATCVYNIDLYLELNKKYKAGIKIGKFNYGGSTILLLINNNNNLLINSTIKKLSNNNIETEVPVRYPIIYN